MSLSAGEKLGPYEILAPIGSGGMGQVYRARDSRLGREVAIKVSAERFSERFDREARAIAALNHPNICHVYDVGPNYLVMELVEGVTLAQRLQRGPMLLEKAMPIARQVIDALEAAHDKGIIHRDLKPGNIMLADDGAVKVLDFGLAKRNDLPEPSGQPENTPTLTLEAATRTGVIMGTAAYMSPEQARGKNVDKRADIWAFGVVLYEMLAGLRLFKGETVSDTLASVLKEEPDWSRIPTQAQRLLRVCLQKDPQQRLHDIADAKLLLEAAPPAEIVRGFSPRLAWCAAGAFLLTTLLIAFVHFRETPSAMESVRFQIQLPPGLSFSDSGEFAVSPDGRKLVFAAVGSDSVTRLWLRSLDSFEVRPLSGTEGVNPGVPPFWSPDSRFIAFTDGRQVVSSRLTLHTIDIIGGPAKTICALAAAPAGGSWNQEGVILFGNGLGIQRVSAAGGMPSPVTVPDSSRQETSHRFPVFLPDGKHFLYLRLSNTAAPENTGIYVGSLDATPGEQSLKQVLSSSYGAQYVASANGPGRLLFLREGTLFAQSFDARTLQLSGEAVPVAERTGTLPQLNGSALFSASGSGTLVYRSGDSRQDRQLTWLDRQGKVIGTVGEPGPYGTVKIAPDRKRAAVVRDGPTGTPDIWLIDLANGAGSRFTFGTAGAGQPVWSPDGSHIAYRSNRDGSWGIYQKASNGTGGEELLSKTVANPNLTEWSRDGRYLLYFSGSARTRGDVWALPVTGSAGDHKPIPLLNTESNEQGAYLSSDSRWLAFMSDESGSQELYVQSFTPPGRSSDSGVTGKWMVSKGTLGMARWRQDGKELVYMAPDGGVMSVEVTSNPVFHAAAPTLLFHLPRAFLGISATPGAVVDATADNQRFLLTMPVVENGPEEFRVVLNWLAGLKK